METIKTVVHLIWGAIPIVILIYLVLDIIYLRRREKRSKEWVKNSMEKIDKLLKEVEQDNKKEISRLKAINDIHERYIDWDEEEKP